MFLKIVSYIRFQLCNYVINKIMIMRGSCLEICHGKRMSAFEIYFWCYYIVLGTTSIPILVKATIVRKAEKSTRENSLCKPSWFWCSIRFMVIFLISVAHESNCLFKIVKNMKILRPLKSSKFQDCEIMLLSEL